MRRLIAAAALLVICLVWVGGAETGNAAWSKKMRGVVSRIRILDQDFRAVPSGWRGVIVRIQLDDVVSMNEKDAADLLRATAKASRKGEKGIRVRLMGPGPIEDDSRGYQLGECWQRSDGSMKEFDASLFRMNRLAIMLDAGLISQKEHDEKLETYFDQLGRPREAKPKPAPAKKAQKESANKAPAGTGQGLEMSRQAILAGLSSHFPKLENIPTNDGQERIFGRSANGLMIIEVYGPAHAAQSANMMVGLTKDDDQKLMAIMQACGRFVENIFPGWPNAAAWMLKALPLAFKFPDQPVLTAKNGKRLKVYYMGDLGLFVVVVEPETARKN